MEAAAAFAGDRDREALRIMRPVRDALPDAAPVRELTGLAEYRVGNYRAAAKELEAFVELTDSAEQHAVLMDCYRAQKRWKRVDELWEESKTVARPREHHLRMWYALADLEERAGNLSAARDLFGRVRRFDPDFSDVAARLASLR